MTTPANIQVVPQGKELVQRDTYVIDEGWAGRVEGSTYVVENKREQLKVIYFSPVSVIVRGEADD